MGGWPGYPTAGPSGVLLVGQGCHNKIPEMGQPKQLELSSSQLWKLESKAKVLAGLISP